MQQVRTCRRPWIIARRLRSAPTALALALTLMPWSTVARAQSLVAPVEVERIDLPRGVLHTRHGASGFDIAQTRLVVLEGDVFRLAEPAGAEDGRAAFRMPRDAAPLTGYATRAWLAPADLAARTAARWPDCVSLHAPVTRAGAGLRTVWLAAGERQGVCVGEVWLRRVRGQPIARCEVRMVEAERSFALVDALVSDLRISVGDAFERWCTPAEAVTGTSGAARETTWSAVVHVEADALADFGSQPAAAGTPQRAPEGPVGRMQPDPAPSSSPAARQDAVTPTQVVWVAAPAGFESLADPRVDFFRDGQFVAHGAAERRDRLFWYVRTLPAASRGRVRVGDDAQIRTPAQIAKRTFVARVLATHSGEELINAGELDGLRVGDVGEVYRGETVLGRVAVHSVQRGYSAVRWSQDGLREGRPPVGSKGEAPQEDAARPVRPGNAAGDAGAVRHVLAPLDEVRFSPPPPRTRELGTVERVVDGLLLEIRPGAGGAAPGSPWGAAVNSGAARAGEGVGGSRASTTDQSGGPAADTLVVLTTSGGKPLGVAVILEASDEWALGLAIRESLSGEIGPGTKVVALPPP